MAQMRATACTRYGRSKGLGQAVPGNAAGALNDSLGSWTLSWVGSASCSSACLTVSPSVKWGSGVRQGFREVVEDMSDA